MALYVAVVVDLVSIATGLMHVRLIDKANAGTASQSDLLASDTRMAQVLVAQIVVLIPCAILFLRWFHRAYVNLRPLGLSPEHGAGWSVGYWFIPILNFFRPVQMAAEIWKGSAESLGRRRHLLLGAWWAAFLGSGFIERAAGFGQVDATLSEVRSTTTICIAADVVSVVAGLLAIVVVSRITAAQADDAKRLESF